MARPKKSTVKLHEPTDRGDVRLYTPDVFLLSGPITKKFAKKNPVVSRTIQIRGDQTLEDLHPGAVSLDPQACGAAVRRPGPAVPSRVDLRAW